MKNTALNLKPGYLQDLFVNYINQKLAESFGKIASQG